MTDARPSFPVLTGDRVVLRPVVAADRDRLLEILREPDVARWWGASPAESVVEDLLHDASVAAFAIEAGGDVVGSIQFGEEEDEDYRHASVDIFLATSSQGRGLGTDAIRTMARFLLEERLHHRLTIDPAADNERAISVYERVGFRRVGVMRAYERGPDGTFHDGLLMDLLAGELR